MNAQAAFPLSRADMQLVARMGFAAARSNQISPARTIFRALRVARPEAVLPFVGLAVTEVAAGRAAEAARLLRDEALREHPGDAQVAAFLGWALAESGRRDEAQKVLRPVVEGALETSAHIEMARGLLSAMQPSHPRTAPL